MSVEFNALYRLHSFISQHDAKWTDEFFKGARARYVPEYLTQKQLDELNIPVDFMSMVIEDGYKRASTPTQNMKKP